MDYIKLAQKSFSEKKYDEVLLALKEKKCVPSILVRCQVFFAKEELHNVKAEVNQGLMMYPNHPDLLSERAVLKIREGLIRDSIQDFDLAVSLQPENPFRFSSRAYAKSLIDDVEGAMEDYRMALALDPDDAVTLNNLGLLEEKLGRKGMAMKNFIKADELIKNGNTRDVDTPLTSNTETIENAPKSTNLLKFMFEILMSTSQRKEFLKWLKANTLFSSKQ
jgi:tetratricopeptide (TPR) repeat protein